MGPGTRACTASALLTTPTTSDPCRGPAACDPGFAPNLAPPPRPPCQHCIPEGGGGCFACLGVHKADFVYKRAGGGGSFGSETHPPKKNLDQKFGRGKIKFE